MTGSQYSEGGETLSMVQPPSIMMESLPSLTQHPPHPQPTSRRPSDVKLECRHTLSGKLGSSVPLAVRRALGIIYPWPLIVSLLMLRECALTSDALP